MKKKNLSKIFAFVAILMLPLLALTACEETHYFDITVLYSDGYRGNTTVNKKSAAEGSEFEITANGLQEGEFVCWIKEGSQVVSSEQTYKFVVNEQTAGTYTALFSQSDASKVMYAALTGIAINREGLNVNQFQVAVKLIPANAKFDQRQIYSNEQISNRTQTKTFDETNNSVFSFLYNDEENLTMNFQLEVTLNYVLSEQSQQETYTAELSEQSFDEDNGYKAVISDQYNIISLTFEKLSLSLFNK